MMQFSSCDASANGVTLPEKCHVAPCLKNHDLTNVMVPLTVSLASCDTDYLIHAMVPLMTPSASHDGASSVTKPKIMLHLILIIFTSEMQWCH